jgi:hypothetical protein
MTDDQRFAAILTFWFWNRTINGWYTLAGEILAQLQVSPLERTADWIVKVIDVFPNDEPETLPHI